MTVVDPSSADRWDDPRPGAGSADLVSGGLASGGRAVTGRRAAVVVRPFDAGAGDVARLVRMFDRLSPTSVYRRFFTMAPKLDGPLLRHLTSVDHEVHEAVVALDGDEMVGLAEYIRAADDPRRAEVAVTVEDAWHHRGVATVLLRELTGLARQRGLTDFTASVLTLNRPALGMVHRLAPSATTRLDGTEVEVRIPLPAA